MRRIVFVALLVACFGAGAIVQKYTLYPLQPVRAVRNAIVGNPLDRFLADTAPKPRNSIFEAFHPHADIVMIGDSITLRTIRQFRLSTSIEAFLAQKMAF
jgi:hypothetical protein